MGKRGARTRKGRFEGSGETDASFEKSGKGTCIFIIRNIFVIRFMITRFDTLNIEF